MNKNVLKALKSAQLVVLALMLTAMFLVVLFYPKVNWIHHLVGSVFILVIQAVLIASNYNRDEEIIKSIGGGGIPDPDGDGK